MKHQSGSSLAIIPARSGSRGIKDKNIRPLAGIPLLAHSVIQALESNCFDTVMLSTDSNEYAEIGRQYGAEVPFLRPHQLSEGHIPTSEVSINVLQYYQSLGTTFDTFAVLAPTSPLRTKEDIQNAFGLMQEKNASVIISVCETSPSPLWSNTLDDTLSMKNFIPKDIRQLPRQTLPSYYHIHGGIFLAKVADYLASQNVYEMESYAYVMPAHRSIDIDHLEDFYVAEIIYNNRER